MATLKKCRLEVTGISSLPQLSSEEKIRSMCDPSQHGKYCVMCKFYVCSCRFNFVMCNMRVLDENDVQGPFQL